MPGTTKSQNQLRDALAKETLELHYQPIHDARTGSVVTAEALLRNPGGQSSRGSELAAAAEAGPQLFEFEEWALKRSFTDAVAWQQAIDRDVRLNVNLSARGLEEADLLETLDAVIRETGANPCALSLEITERSFIRRPAECVPLIEEIRARGFEVWLDDFGSGHSSLTHLHLFPLDGLKIPGEYIVNIANNECSQILVRHVIEMAHELGLKTTSENVETEVQLKMLRDLGCDYVQGFYYSRAMPVERFNEYLQGATGRPATGSTR
jgi:EAL domain-containing protein (putative c-di-GMP-specific phosphodiesterase class I)